MMKGKALLNQLHGAAVFRRRVRILARLMAQELHDAAQVLDVGTGDGSIAAEIGRLRPDVTITRGRRFGSSGHAYPGGFI